MEQKESTNEIHDPDVYNDKALRLGLVTVLSELGFSPDSACPEPVKVSDK